MGDKMFIIGGNYNSSCAVFDAFSRKFTLFKVELPKFKCSLSYINKAVCIGSNIFVISWNSTWKDTMYVYECHENSWSKKRCNVLKYLTGLTCVKYYTD